MFGINGWAGGKEGGDPGASATRVAPGDMTARIIACGARATSVLNVPRPQPFSVVGLRYCGVNISQPATYVITFSVSHAGGPEAFAQRTVVVEADCPSGEVSRLSCW